jgi:hypothetical protein
VAAFGWTGGLGLHLGLHSDLEFPVGDLILTTALAADISG